MQSAVDFFLLTLLINVALHFFLSCGSFLDPDCVDKGDVTCIMGLRNVCISVTGHLHH